MHYQRKEGTVLYIVLQRNNTENSKQIIPGKELRGLSPIKDKVRNLCWTGQKGEGRAVGEYRSGRESCRSGRKWEESCRGGKYCRKTADEKNNVGR